ncbi:DUF4097 family beta strand repeat-containing protein [Shewanella sp.]|uniref:DUF4097 family beta strand repeat-containing protein n=1 Tax=Shewanella sp. TaxID=50422 RepID=UPI003A96D996
MKWQSTLIFALATSVSTLAVAADKVDKQAPLAAGEKVDLQVQRGNVTIQSWDKDEVSITGTLDEKSQGLVFEQQGGKFVIEDKLPRQYSGNNNDGSALKIMLPKKISLKLNGVSTDYQLSGLDGNIDGNNVSGELSLNQLSGDISLRTVSGNITATGLSGKLALETVSGDIKDQQSSGTARYSLVSGDLNADSQATEVYTDIVSGKIQLQLQRVEQLELNAVSGDTKVTLDTITKKAELNSVSGDIKLSFSQLPDAEFDINGGPSGEIENKLSSDKPVKAKYTRSETLSFQTGAATANIAINTISGDIELLKK